MFENNFCVQFCSSSDLAFLSSTVVYFATSCPGAPECEESVEYMHVCARPSLAGSPHARADRNAVAIPASGKCNQTAAQSPVPDCGYWESLCS
eukprot:2142632-Amphidinium_carterae.1